MGNIALCLDLPELAKLVVRPRAKHSRILELSCLVMLIIKPSIKLPERQWGQVEVDLVTTDWRILLEKLKTTS